MNMDTPTYVYLTSAMNLAKAQEGLTTKEIISYPHLDKDNQNRIHNKMLKDAQTDKMRADSAVTTDQLKVSGISIGNIADVIKDK